MHKLLSGDKIEFFVGSVGILALGESEKNIWAEVSFQLVICKARY